MKKRLFCVFPCPIFCLVGMEKFLGAPFCSGGGGGGGGGGAQKSVGGRQKKVPNLFFFFFWDTIFRGATFGHRAGGREQATLRHWGLGEAGGRMGLQPH